MMKRGGLLLAGVVMVALSASCGSGAPGGRSAEAPATTPAADAAERVIWASGKLVPMQWTGLSAASSGTVKAIHVVEGDRVQEGDLLLELNPAPLRSQLAVAAAAVAEAEAARARLLAPATGEQIVQAEADVALARAGVQSAQAGVETARRAAAAAEGQIAVAQAQYNELAGHPTPAEKVAAQRGVALATAALRQAQAAYNQVKGDPDIAMRPEAVALEQATVGLDSARAAYDAAVWGATPQQLAVARAGVTAAQAQAQVAASQVSSAESAVRAAEAQLAKAEAALQALVAGATEEDIAVADSRIASERAALAVVETQLGEMQVRAPFAGQVGTVSVRPGELAVPGQVLVMLGDTTKLRVETTDLRETDVTRLGVGMPAEVTFDALPGRSFAGTVARIAPMSTTEKGSTNYTLIIDVADLDPSLRWGMTAFVNMRGQ